MEVLEANGFGFIKPGERSSPTSRRTARAEGRCVLERLYIDVFLDDFPAYVTRGCPVRLLVQPDLETPYYDDSWQTDGAEGEFGRRQRVRRFTDH